MLYVLDKEEFVEHNKRRSAEISNWWDDLTFSDKEMIYDHYQIIFRQRDCSHNFVKNKMYDKDIRVCIKCAFIDPQSAWPEPQEEETI